MDKKIEKAISKLLNMYEKIENDLLVEIASHFSINDEFLNSDYWRMKKLEEMGLFNQDIIDYLSRETKHTEAEVKSALNQIGIETVNLDRLNRLFEDEVLKINPNILVNNYTIKNIINLAYNEVSNSLIQMSSKIEKGARQAYLNVVEQAYLKTSMGTHSYQEAIKESINDLSNKGIKVLTYKTVDEDGNVVGIRDYDIESAVRREVLTASRQLNNAIAMEVAEKLDCEYLYLSEHLQCRPSHFDWQGTVIKREDLIKVTHYGEIDGLAGINCRHYFEPYFGDARDDELKHFNKEECTNAYNLSQHQRYLERGIRKWKRKSEVYKANDDFESYSKCKSKVSEWQSRIKNFTDENDLRRDYNREYVKESNKKILPYKDITQEWIDESFDNKNVDLMPLKNGDKFKYGDMEYIYDGKQVKYDFKLEEIEFGKYLSSKKKNIYFNPTINEPDGISTADLTIDNYLYDMKITSGKSSQLLYHNMRGKERQSHRFLFEVTNSPLSLKGLEKQIENVFKRKDMYFVEVIGIKKDSELKIFERK